MTLTLVTMALQSFQGVVVEVVDEDVVVVKVAVEGTDVLLEELGAQIPAKLLVCKMPQNL